MADAVAHLAHRTREGASTVRRDLRNRTRGVITAAGYRFAREQPEDVVLEERVHSALGRLVAHPHAITVKVHHRCVVLDGPIPPNRQNRIIDAVRAIRGVRDVETRFDRHIQPAHEASSQAQLGEDRTSPKPDFLQRHWAPATRAILGASGAALVGTGIIRRDRTSIGLAAAGAALVARAATNVPVYDLMTHMKPRNGNRAH